jgi:hypothetical protein
MLVSDLIKASMRKITAVASGEVPTTNEYADGLTALQSMLRSWAAEKIFVFASTKESFTLVSGTYQYTWGTGGTITTARPNQVIGAYVLEGSTTHPVEVITEGKYRSITVKSSIGRPYALFFHPTYPLANVYLYPVPDTAESMYVDSFKPFTETSSFDAITSTLSFPSMYEEALIYNLAIRLASEFGKAVPAEVAVIASKSWDRISNVNAANQVEPIGVAIPLSSSRSGYNINTDSYK